MEGHVGGNVETHHEHSSRRSSAEWTWITTGNWMCQSSARCLETTRRVRLTRAEKLLTRWFASLELLAFCDQNNSSSFSCEEWVTVSAQSIWLPDCCTLRTQ